MIFEKIKATVPCGKAMNWRTRAYCLIYTIGHNVDVMHVEMNICDISFGTLLGSKRKTGTLEWKMQIDANED